MSRNKGFSLLEILISVVILSIVITSISMIYRGAFTSSAKAEKHIKLAAVVPGILFSVRQSVRKSNFNADVLEGEGSNGSVIYKWKAITLSKKDYSNAPEGTLQKSPMFASSNSYKLWRVTLSVTILKVSKEYTYHEVSWLE